MISRSALFAPIAGLMLAAAPMASWAAGVGMHPIDAGASSITDVRDGGGQGGGGGDRSGGGGGSAGRSGGGGGGSVGRSGDGGGGSGITGGGGDRGSIGRSGGRHSDSAQRGDGNSRGGRHHANRHRGGGLGIYVKPDYGYSDYGYGSGECDWLRRRAVNTGSRYWWRRYRDCLD